jgi:hypothetical protein
VRNKIVGKRRELTAIARLAMPPVIGLRTFLVLQSFVLACRTVRRQSAILRSTYPESPQPAATRGDFAPRQNIKKALEIATFPGKMSIFNMAKYRQRILSVGSRVSRAR